MPTEPNGVVEKACQKLADSKEFSLAAINVAKFLVKEHRERDFRTGEEADPDAVLALIKEVLACLPNFRGYIFIEKTLVTAEKEKAANNAAG